MLLLRGFGIGSFRSFHGDLQTFLPLKKIVVISGHNNAGKSNVLRFLSESLSKFEASQRAITMPHPQGDDLPIGASSHDALRFGIAVPLDHLRQMASRAKLPQEISPLYKVGATSDGESLWIELSLERGSNDNWKVSDTYCAHLISKWTGLKLPRNQQWEFVSRHLAGIIYGQSSMDPLEVMQLLLSTLIIGYRLPPIYVIDATRRVESESGDEAKRRQLAGAGLIDRLADLQNPDTDQWHRSRTDWAAINAFVRRVLGDESSELHIPANRRRILVTTRGTTLPLDALGSGIAQVIILAAAATVHRDSVVCIEEPETHLHPILQRKLLLHLVESTSNQYLLTTHSAHFLDYERAAIFHVGLSEGRSQVTSVSADSGVVRATRDLGYRPSDLVQSNSVVWVEGPADRIYVNRWLALIAPHLHEGEHYSTMFYGGSMLNHLSVSEDAFADFIRLRRINSHSAVIIDSDRKRRGAVLNATKRRIREEFLASDAPGFSWVTDGYTIENYIPPAKLQGAVAHVHPRTPLAPTDVRWGNPLTSARAGQKFDKVRIAEHVVPLLTVDDMRVWNLARNVAQLAAFIERAND